MARLPLDRHAAVMAIVHFPASRYYQLMDYNSYQTHLNSTTAKATRLVFYGTLNEAAHFVLNQQLSLLVGSNGHPHLPDNQSPPVDDAAIVDDPAPLTPADADSPDPSAGVTAVSIVTDADTGASVKITTQRTKPGADNGDH